VPPGLQPRGLPLAKWSANGRNLFVSFRPTNQRTRSGRVYVRTDERAWRPVTPEGLDSGPFVVSPDGAFIAMADETRDVTLFPTDGGPSRRLYGERGVPLLWSSDSRWLFLSSRVTDGLSVSVYRRDLNSGRIEPWRELAPSDLSGVSAYSSILVADDGRICVYQYSRASADLFLVQGVR